MQTHLSEIKKKRIKNKTKRRKKKRKRNNSLCHRRILTGFYREENVVLVGRITQTQKDRSFLWSNTKGPLIVPLSFSLFPSKVKEKKKATFFEGRNIFRWGQGAGSTKSGIKVVSTP